MNIGFVIDLWENLRPEEDSTLRLIFEAIKREHRVGIIYPKNLTIRHNVTTGLFKIVPRKFSEMKNLKSFCSKVEFRAERLPVKGFDVIFVRKNPPTDTNMLHFLDSVQDDTFLINSVDGIRKAGSKLYITTFEDSHDIIPETHISKDKDYLLSVIEESKSERFVVKPLDGFQGRGVIVLEKRAMDNVSSLLDFYLTSTESKSYIILQEYIDAADEGDTRVLMLNGEPIGAMRRKPAEGEFRANIHTGGKAVKHTLTAEEKDVCRRIGPKLVADGIYLAGVDLMGGKLIEVNVRSPGGIMRINALNRTRLETKILDFAEYVHRRSQSAIERKIIFRETVKNA